MSAAILSLDAVKSKLGITDTASDEKLTAALPVITEYFENYCKRGLAFVADVVEEISPAARLKLFRYPLDPSSLAVLIDGVVILTPFRVDAARGFVELGYAYSWPVYPNQIARVTYDGGYHEADVPADLADAYARACADYGGVAYTSGGSTGGGAPLKSLGLGSGATDRKSVV